MTLLTPAQLNDLQSVLKNLSKNQLLWVSGYVYGLVNSAISDVTTTDTSSKLLSKSYSMNNSIIVVSASQTGNARRLAEQLHDDFIQSKLNVVLYSAGEFKFKKIAEFKLLILIISTYGEGEPPEEAIAFYKYLFSQKASRMENTNFAIFSLGDRSYEYFAKAGKDFDKRFEELGAKRFLDRVDVDIDFQTEAIRWRKKIVDQVISKMFAIFSENQENNIRNTQSLSNRSVYSKEYPFIACLSNRQKITSRNSIKDIHHIEIDITGSNLSYQPGDALGIWYENDPNLVDELLELLGFNGLELVEIKGQSISVSDALQKHYELTRNTSIVIKNIANISKNKLLLNLLNNQEKLHLFIKTTPIIDMIRQISVKLSPYDLLMALRPMQPRFYSISSAQSEVGEEIHITVSVIRYQVNGHFRFGGASSYLVDRLKENDKICIFIESNNNFRLPKDHDVPVIMIGVGTGIAPFRAFMQQRASDRATGKNWLFFGNVKFIDDFLYQTEWQYYVKIGLLNKINTAWSRDQDYKVYVQDKLLQNGLELWSWIQDGAYIYVCGDAKNMAVDVERALVILVSKYGNMNTEQANDFWDKMRAQRRYQKDVY